MLSSGAEARRPSPRSRGDTARALTIGQLAERTGFSAKTIRYYEAVGLLPEPRRRPSGYRQYDESAADRLAFVGRAKRLGLSLAEIRSVLVLHDTGTQPCEHVRGLLDLQIRRVDEALDQLTAFRRQLARLRRSARGRSTRGAAVCRIVEHAAIDLSALELPALARRRRQQGANA